MPLAATAAAICLCVCRSVVKINTRLPSWVVVASVLSVCACTAAVVCFFSPAAALLYSPDPVPIYLGRL